MVQLNTSENLEMVFLAPNSTDENAMRQVTWMKHVFVPKVSKWIVSMEADDEERKKSAFDTIESLSLISLTEYNQLYNDLKVKYGEHMVKVGIVFQTLK